MDFLFFFLSKSILFFVSGLEDKLFSILLMYIC